MKNFDAKHFPILYPVYQPFLQNLFPNKTVISLTSFNQYIQDTANSFPYKISKAEYIHFLGQVAELLIPFIPDAVYANNQFHYKNKTDYLTALKKLTK